jgi:hypothetical protein
VRCSRIILSTCHCVKMQVKMWSHLQSHATHLTAARQPTIETSKVTLRLGKGRGWEVGLSAPSTRTAGRPPYTCLGLALQTERTCDRRQTSLKMVKSVSSLAQTSRRALRARDGTFHRWSTFCLGSTHGSKLPQQLLPSEQVAPWRDQYHHDLCTIR